MSDLIIGYFNPNRYTPSPVTIIFKRGDEFYMRYPALSEYSIPSSGLIKLVDDECFTVAEEGKILKEFEYAYAVNKKKIFVGAHDIIVKSITDLLEGKTLSENEHRLMSLYIFNSVPKIMPAREFLS